jgi:hypothetical protein
MDIWLRIRREATAEPKSLEDLLNVEEFESRRRDMNTLELPFEKEDGNEDALGDT